MFLARTCRFSVLETRPWAENWGPPWKWCESCSTGSCRYFCCLKIYLRVIKCFFAVAWYLASLCWSYALGRREVKIRAKEAHQRRQMVLIGPALNLLHDCPSQHCREARLWFPSASLWLPAQSFWAAPYLVPSETVPFPPLMERQILSTLLKCASALIVAGMSHPGWSHSITEYLEGTHKDHGIQPLAVHRNTHKLDPMSVSVVQMVLKVWQAQCPDHCPGEPVPVPDHLPMKDLFTISNLNLSCCSGS